MDHTEFKANQTAASYVADGLDERTLEEFEMHLMECKECLEEVETWRAIKVNMPRNKARPVLTPAALGRHTHAAADWRMAASVAIGAFGSAVGWFGHAFLGPAPDPAGTVFFNLPAVARAADECTTLKLAPDTHSVVLRVPGLSRDRHVIALDADKHELPPARYDSRLQPDGSHVVRIDAGVVAGRATYLEVKAPDGLSEPLGCVSGEVVSH